MLNRSFVLFAANDISIGSSVFAQLICASNTQTTMRVTCRNGPYLRNVRASAEAHSKYITVSFNMLYI